MMFVGGVLKLGNLTVYSNGPSPRHTGLRSAESYELV